MPLDRYAKEQKPVDVAEQGLRAINSRLKLRCAALQKHVDEQGEEWRKGIPSTIFSTESAVGATRQYSRQWFDKQLWSDDVKLAILRDLVAACRRYPVVDVSAWKEMIDDVVDHGASTETI